MYIYTNQTPICDFTPVLSHDTTSQHTHTFVSVFQNLDLVLAQFHLESEHSQFYDASDPECLLADPEQCHLLFLGNPNLRLLFYSGGNVGNEEGLLERRKG
jgi:hypothetical protein